MTEGTSVSRYPDKCIYCRYNIMLFTRYNELWLLEIQIFCLCVLQSITVFVKTQLFNKSLKHLFKIFFFIIKPTVYGSYILFASNVKIDTTVPD